MIGLSTVGRSVAQFCTDLVSISHVTALVLTSLRLEEEGPVIFIPLCLFLLVGESNMKQDTVSNSAF